MTYITAVVKFMEPLVTLKNILESLTNILWLINKRSQITFPAENETTRLFFKRARKKRRRDPSNYDLKKKRRRRRNIAAGKQAILLGWKKLVGRAKIGLAKGNIIYYWVSMTVRYELTALNRLYLLPWPLDKRSYLRFSFTNQWLYINKPLCLLVI